MIFLDNASTTRVSDECVKIANKYMTDNFFNPSAPYHPSVEVAENLKNFRNGILRSLKGNGKIIFTSSGTESDNLAIFGTKKPNKSKIIFSQSEHPAVKNCAEELRRRGYEVLFAEVDSSARVIESKFAEMIDESVSFVSVMHVNNETGAINDVKKLCAIAKRKNPDLIFHSDGVQAAGKIKVNLEDLDVDLYSVSGHKLQAPRGVGALYVKKGVNLHPIIYGGGQEFGVRSSTENTAAIAALDYALRSATENYEENFQKVKNLNSILREELNKNSEAYKIVSAENSSPYILNFALKYVRGEVMLHSLEKYSIYIGTGSACSSQKAEKNISTLFKLPEEYKKGVLRVSLSPNTTINDINTFTKCLNLEYFKLEKYMRG